ncbi:peptidoglycan DD-metalloendopeptidase family protein [Marinicella sp. W31]|uniref:peptidoglycan DD-metalloendopeptidase family protein n=1 Tax=Marinicella sp. W31 TaxID=3023713 RepID=UPI003756C331
MAKSPYTFLCLFITVVLLIHISTTASGKKFYKYIDENGITHYSDKPPETEQPVESWKIRAEDTKLKVRIVNRGTKREPRLYAVNPYNGPVQVHMKLIEQSNLVTEPSLPRSIVVPALRELHLASLGPIDTQKGWSYSYQYDVAFGDPNAQHTPREGYRMPYPKGANVFISQSFNGEITHSQDDANRFAVDLAMPEGTDILAARSGVVMDLVRDFYEGGTHAKYLRRSNFVRILHADGSMAIYSHLKPESTVVRKGQRIKKGQKLAQSGNTGYSSGPHLHFAIQVNQNMKLKSVPFEFTSGSGVDFTPEVGPVPN